MATPAPAVLLPLKFAVPPFKLKLVLLIVSVPLAAVALSPRVPVPVAQTFTPLKLKLLLANNVSVELLGLLTTRSAATVKLPPALPLLAVVTVTFVPVANASVIEVLRTLLVVLAPSPLHTLLALVTLALVSALMVISVGSINHSPFFPLLAPLTLPSIVRV